MSDTPGSDTLRASPLLGPMLTPGHAFQGTCTHCGHGSYAALFLSTPHGEDAPAPPSRMTITCGGCGYLSEVVLLDRALVVEMRVR